MHLASSYIHAVRDGEIGKCLIRVFEPERQSGGRDSPVVICTELADNPGLSILHHTSRIAGQFLSLHRDALPGVPVWIEHLPSADRPSTGSGGEEFFLTTFDSYEARETRSPYLGEALVEIGSPTRKPLDRETVQTLVGMRV